MVDTKEYTKAKLKGVTSNIKTSRRPSIVPTSTGDGVKPPMEERDAVIMQLARLLDVMNSWPCQETDAEGKKKMPKPLIGPRHVIVAFPLGGHVIENGVTSEEKMNFVVDDVTVITEAVNA